MRKEFTKKRKIKGLLLTGAGVLLAAVVLISANLFTIGASSNNNVSSGDIDLISENGAEQDSSDVIYYTSKITCEEETGDLQMVNLYQPKRKALRASAFPASNDAMGDSSASLSYNGSYGSELDALSKEIYDSCVQHYAVNKDNSELVIDLNNPVTFTTKLIVTETVTEEISEENSDSDIDNLTKKYCEIDTGDANYINAFNKMVNSVNMASASFMYDHPEVFWIRSLRMEFEAGGVDNIAADENGELYGDVTFTKATLSISVYTYNGAYDDIAEFDSGVNAALNGLSGTTNYEKLKSAHDFVCNKIVYDYEAAKNAGNNAYGYAHCAGPVFVDIGKNVVCEGYAKAFKVLCDKMNIPCALIYGKGGTGAHMWNYVQLDGKWYAVDATWDDGGSKIIYDYFLVGSNTKVSGNTTFSDKHTNNGVFSGNRAFEFAYPPLNKSKYTGFKDSYDVTPNIVEGASKLYEPWGLRYIAEFKGDDADCITDRGIAILKDTYYTGGMSPESFVANSNAHVYLDSKNELGFDKSTSRYSAALTEGIYSYDIGAYYYVVPFAVMENGKTIYGTIKRNSMEKILNSNINSSSISSNEKAVCRCILALKKSVAQHYASSGVPGVSLDNNIPRGSSQTAAASIKTMEETGITPNVKTAATRLIEPWGMRYTIEYTENEHIVKRGAAIIHQDYYNSSYVKYPDNMRINPQAYVYHDDDNTLTVKDGTNNYCAIISGGISSSNIGDSYYVVPFVILDDGSYVYGNVKYMSMLKIMNSNLSSSSVSTTENAVNRNIVSLYNAVCKLYGRS